TPNPVSGRKKADTRKTVLLEPRYSATVRISRDPTLLVFIRWLWACAGRDAVGKTADHEIRNDGQQGSDGQQLPRVNPMKDDHLIDHVDDQREQENPAHGLPPLAQQELPVSRVGDDGPGEGGPTFAGVPQPRPEGKEDRHRRLNDQPKSHEPVGATEQ